MGEYFKIGDVNFAMEVKASKAWCSKVCYFCGKYIKENNKHSDYNALKSLGECVSNAIKTTNEMMNN